MRVEIAIESQRFVDLSLPHKRETDAIDEREPARLRREERRYSLLVKVFLDYVDVDAAQDRLEVAALRDAQTPPNDCVRLHRYKGVGDEAKFPGYQSPPALYGILMSLIIGVDERIEAARVDEGFHQLLRQDAIGEYVAVLRRAIASSGVAGAEVPLDVVGHRSPAAPLRAPVQIAAKGSKRDADAFPLQELVCLPDRVVLSANQLAQLLAERDNVLRCGWSRRAAGPALSCWLLGCVANGTREALQGGFRRWFH